MRSALYRLGGFVFLGFVFYFAAPPHENSSWAWDTADFLVCSFPSKNKLLCRVNSDIQELSQHLT